MRTGMLIGLAVIAAGAFLLIKQRKSTREILEGMFPEGFTASVSQLDCLEASGYPQGSRVYEEAIDIAYNDVAASCGTGEVVWWSSEEGYYCGLPGG